MLMECCAGRSRLWAREGRREGGKREREREERGERGEGGEGGEGVCRFTRSSDALVCRGSSIHPSLLVVALDCRRKKNVIMIIINRVVLSRDIEL